MGIFGEENNKSQNSNDSEEVKISAPEPEDEPSDLKKAVESKFSSSPSRKSSMNSSVSVDDLYEQNERIIELLETIADDDINDTGPGGGLNGVL